MAEDEQVRFRDPEIAAVATSMAARLRELADRLAERILKTVDAYGPGAPVPPDDLRTTLRDHLEFIFGQLARLGPVDLTVPGRPAGAAADRGAPLAAIMDAYRVGSRFIWDSFVEEAWRSGHASSEALVRAASDIWVLTDAHTEAMISAYPDAISEQMLRPSHSTKSGRLKAVEAGVKPHRSRPGARCGNDDTTPAGHRGGGVATQVLRRVRASW